MTTRRKVFSLNLKSAEPLLFTSTSSRAPFFRSVTEFALRFPVIMSVRCFTTAFTPCLALAGCFARAAVPAEGRATETSRTRTTIRARATSSRYSRR